MSRNRCTLHVSKLPEFAAWCRDNGWTEDLNLGEYEVWKARKGAAVAVIHRREATNICGALVHYTTHGFSETLRRQWQKERKPV